MPASQSHRRKLALLLAIVLTAGVAAPVSSAVAAGQEPATERLVVVMEPGLASNADAARTLGARGLHVQRTLLGGRALVLDVPSTEIAALAEELSELPGVASAEPDYPVRLAWEPDDPDFSYQWAYGRVQATSAWDVERGEPSVVVAVIDTGVDLSHPELVGRLDTDNDRDFTVAPEDPGYTTANDQHGHGTHVAGIVAAESDNATGVAGTAPLVTILPLKVFGASGTGNSTDLVAAIEYAVSLDVDVINLSLAFDYGVAPEVVNEAIHTATLAGIVVVAAAGNSGSAGVRYPAAYPDCIAVGASTSSDTRAYFSTYGPELDIVAPGGRVNTLAPTPQEVWSTYPGGYAYLEGTSMATPFVSAAAALLKSYDASATPDEIRSALERSAKDIGGAGFDIYTGHGLLQMRNALDALAGADVAPPVTTSGALPSYDDSATLVFTADDGAGSGVAATYFRVDGAATQRGASVSVTGYGPHVLEYWSDDLVGNVEETRSAAFVIHDTIAPSTTSNAVSAYDATATITLAATDGTGSGVAVTYHTLDGSDPASGPVVVTSEMGEHTLTYWSVDGAGNIESPVHVATFRVFGVPAVARLAGDTRYQTAVRLSEQAFAAGSAPTVVLASGEVFADALSASALAGALDGPLLLTNRSYVPAVVLSELERLGATNVIIVGGDGAVSNTMESILAGAGLSADRIAGLDRYETAARVAMRVATESETETMPAVFLVRGDLFADALAVSSVAASRAYPVLLTRSGSLTPVTAQAIGELNAEEVVIAGGTGAVFPEVAEAVAELPGAPVVTRWDGTDRYATAASVVRNSIDRGWVGAGLFALATGADFPDALGGGVGAAAQGGALLLTTPASLSGVSAALISANGVNHLPLWVLGGVGAVSAETETSLRALRF